MVIHLRVKMVMDEFPLIFTDSQEEILREGILFDPLTQSDSDRLLESFVTSTEDQKPFGLHFDNLSSTGKLPCFDTYKGHYDFELDLGLSSKSCIHSPELNKLFVGIGIKFPVKFKWTRGVQGLFVRALPMFVAQEFVQDPVERCHHHCDIKDTSNENFNFLEHVLRAESTSAQYFTDAISQRHSVLIPLEFPQPGADSFPVMFKFVCKNSCPSGMNRRSTRIIFTLEDVSGNVYGRQTIFTRVCSCPKRDKDKEEMDAKKASTPPCPTPKGKRPINTVSRESSKKIKLGENYKVNCPDFESYCKVLQFAHGLLSSKIRLESREPTPREDSFLIDYEKSL